MFFFYVWAVAKLSLTCACTWPLSSSCLVSTKCICPCAVGIDVVTTTPSWLPLFLSDTVQTFAPLLPWVTFSLFSSKLSRNREAGGKISTINSIPIRCGNAARLARLAPEFDWMIGWT